MTLNYRSLFETSADADPIERMRAHFRDWLRSKRDDARSPVSECDWDGPGVYKIGDGVDVTEVSRQEEDGSRLLRLVLREQNEGGEWVTQATAAHRPGDGAWSRFIWVETSNDQPEGRDPMPPRLIKHLLGDLDATNGLALLSDQTRVVRGQDSGEVERLIEALEGERRAVPIVVGATFSDVPIDRWARLVEELTKFGIGVVSSVVADEDAAARLNEWLGETHRIPLGGVRTFLPGVRPGSQIDAYRHRYITARTLAETVDRHSSGSLRVRPALARALAWNARRSVLEAGLPKQVRRVDALLRRAEHQQTATTATRSPLDLLVADASAPQHVEEAVSGVPPSLMRLGEFVRDMFGANELKDEHVAQFGDLVSALSRDVSVLQSDIETNDQLLESASDEVEELRRQLNDAELAAAIAEEARRKAEREATWYAGKLKKAQQFEALNVPDEPEAPADLIDLLDRLQDTGHPDRHELLDRVVFTGDVEPAQELARYDTVGRIAGAAWDVLLALGDYADAKHSEENPINLYEYLGEPPAGRKAVSRQRFAAKESSTVAQNPEWRRERTFPVPESVEPSGRVFMQAHFKLGGGDTVAPRLHLYDAVDVDGKIYVGYIGRHLTNTKT